MRDDVAKNTKQNTVDASQQKWWRRLGIDGDARDLAALRVAVFVTILGSVDARWVVDFAKFPVELAKPPSGAGWLVAVLDLGGTGLTVAVFAMLAASALALFGLWSRSASAVVALLGLIVFGVPQLFGTVRHVHHLVWLAALLAASPCGDAWSLDAWLARRRGLQGESPLLRRGVRYGLPLMAAWAVAGCVYLFPGVHKLVESGLSWALSDNLVNQMRWKWLQFGALPAVRIDQWPRVVQFGGIVVLCFELLWLPLAMFKRPRIWLLAATLVFHQVTAVFFFIRFSTLWVCWLGLFPWGRLVDRLGAGDGEQTPAVQRPVTRALLPVVAILLAGIVITGGSGLINGWPFACYPTFANTVKGEMPALRVEVFAKNGESKQVRPWAWADGDQQRQWRQMWRLVLEVDPKVRNRILKAWLLQHRDRLGGDFDRVVMWRVWLATAPEDHAVQRRNRALATFASDGTLLESWLSK